MARTSIIILGIILVTAFMAVMVILVSFVTAGGDTAHKVGRIWAKCILALSNIRVTVKGLSNLKPGRSYIYMANHMSNFDIPVLQAFLPVQFRWLAKAELYKIPVFGYAMKRAGYISIDRSDRKSAIESLNKAVKIIRDGISVVIFPEGTRSRNHNIQPFKKGGFFLAVDSGVPIIPIIIHGTERIMPKKQMLIKPGNVTLEIAKPINSSDYTRKTKNDLMDKIRDIFLKSFEKNKKNGSLC
ncbi:MAG: 1-acyl-sn-glycerol-3-phosphate acyltransferase [Desulfobacteraceae bacterium]|nr:1-acyl-sn-glycerol-3-phosphate acyltransferase [Desulfobacteraceae bacterium]